MVDISAEDLAVTCAHVVDERKAEDINVLRVGPLTTITEYFVIATGRNVRQLQALARALEDRLEEVGAEVYGMEGEPESGWILIDAGDAIVHMFSPEKRELYALEMLWGSCEKVEWSEKQPLVAEDSAEQD